MLTRAERSRLPVLLEASRARPMPRDLRSRGCVTVVASALGLLFLPRLVEALELRWVGGPILLVLLSLTLVMGIFLALAGRSLQVGRQYRRIEEAAETLVREYPEGSREAALAAAVELLALARLPSGAATREAYDPRAMAIRLGDALPLAVAVEQELVRKGAMEPVFTSGAGGAPSANGQRGG